MLVPATSGADSGWISLVPNAKYRKKNGYVTVVLAVDGLTSDNWNTIGTLPSGYRADIICYFMGSNGGTGSYNCLITIDTNGVVKAKPLGGTYAYGTCVFPVA